MISYNKQRIVQVGQSKYSYEEMRADIWKLWNQYKELLEVRILGKTLDNRNIYGIRFGNPLAPRCIMVNAALHGREWLNTQLMMLQLEHYCRKYNTGIYHGRKYQDLFDEVCVYLLPMMNPDGVAVSQYGPCVIRDTKLRETVQSLAGKEYRFWKANAKGVDLNRNFNSGFGKNPVKRPAAMEYGGQEPLSEPEAKALVQLVEAVKPVGVINYHEAGPFIYYTKFSEVLFAVRRATGYQLKLEKGGCPGSFGDWLTDREIACCTVETCRGKAPVGHWQIYPTYLRNYHVLAAAAASVCGRDCVLI